MPGIGPSKDFVGKVAENMKKTGSSFGNSNKFGKGKMMKNKKASGGGLMPKKMSF